jgi:probable HAF family extracellular repeat protein
MKRFFCCLLVLGLLVELPAHAKAQPTYAFTTFDVPGSSSVFWTQASGINASGQIVGSFDLHGFLLDQGSYTILDPPSAIPNEAIGGDQATGINASGQIVGVYDANDVYGPLHGFLYDQGSYTTLDVPGASRTGASGINASGQIVGWYGDAVGVHGFLLDQGSYTTLDVPGSTTGDWGTRASGINASGQIVGYYGDVAGIHGFLATPVR